MAISPCLLKNVLLRKHNTEDEDDFHELSKIYLN